MHIQRRKGSINFGKENVHTLASLWMCLNKCRANIILGKHDNILNWEDMWPYHGFIMELVQLPNNNDINKICRTCFGCINMK